MTATTCPACGGTALRRFHRADRLPVHSCLLVPTRDEAVGFPTGEMELGHCTACGFVTNLRFDVAHNRYSSAYEETQGFSPRFQAFARELAERWADRYDLRGRTVLEIGCGKGEFLELLCAVGDNDGIGIDPAYVPERLPTGGDGPRLTFLRELYGEQHLGIEADAVVCRHTLEHIAPVADFMRLVRRGIGDRLDTIVLFELPDALRVFQEAAFWDVYYEHCSYFTTGSLERLFVATGFEVLDVALDFDDQYILVEARPAPAGSSPALRFASDDELDVVAKAVDYFDAAVTDLVDRWRSTVTEIAAGGGRVAVWGSGSKGVAFLTTLGAAAAGVSHVVDINPHKHGRFMAGTGHEIVAPDRLVDAPPDLVVAMNPIYLDEIRAMLDELGLAVELVAV